jgi:hypothetical protein
MPKERIRVIEHKGHSILLLDFSGLNPDEIIGHFEELNRTAVLQKIRLLLLDVRNTYSNDKIKSASRESIRFIEERLGTVQIALVGLRRIQMIVANAINRDQYFAKDISDAMDWLAKRAEAKKKT